jgi:formate-dependent nitrite reductase membrane component NrfD
MKKIFQWPAFKSGLALAIFTLIQVVAFGQDNANVSKEEVGNWFQQNWMWVAGGVLLLIIILLFASGSKKNKIRSTTVVKDQYGTTKRVTTTEVDKT